MGAVGTGRMDRVARMFASTLSRRGVVPEGGPAQAGVAGRVTTADPELTTNVQCPSGTVPCTVCVSTSSDPNHCGVCGHVCSFPNATASCVDGVCQIALCNPGFANCDGILASGCETNVSADPSNCGVCGHVCNPLNAASVSCSNGVCQYVCNAGFANCTGGGCVTNISTDANNCGACGHACPPGHGCVDGVCN